MKSNANDPGRKISSLQKKPPASNSYLPPLTRSAKKRKTAEGLVDVGVENLNDVIAASAINEKEEHEQLFSCPEVSSCISEMYPKDAPEDENKLFLNKMPLQMKLSEIMAKFGLENLSSDVEPCLSQRTEQRLRHLISECIRMSKERIDSERSRQNVLVTSQARDQGLVKFRETREEWTEKQAELEKTRNQNVNNGVDNAQLKSEANAAIRASVGGSDMLSIWRQMAKARQKNGGGHSKTSLSTEMETREGRRANHTTSLSGEKGEFGGKDISQVCSAARKTISIKDVISVLEREPQMAKSTFMYRLYGRKRALSC